MSLKYNLVTVGDEQNLTLFHDGEMYVASEQHPNWAEIKRLLLSDDESVVDLFDVPGSLSKKFHRLTETVTVQGGRVCFNGDPLGEVISNKILEYLDSGTDDWEPLVNFVEKVQANPSENSREQLYQFLEHREYDILPDGNILGYKGLTRDASDADLFKSIHSGHAFVNDDEVNGLVGQRVGDTVTMPRSEVDDNTGAGCSTGLHVSDFAYAKTYGDVVMAVSVNPRDTVSVPRYEVAKMRVCRYTNLGVVKDMKDRHSYKQVPDDVTGAAAEDDFAKSAVSDNIAW
jgi:hypothetical protein